MGAFADISAALDNHTALLALPTAWENKSFSPKTGTLYLRVTLLPADTDVTTIDLNASNEDTGIYQVDVFAPQGKGKGQAVAQADAIADHFNASTVDYNATKVRIRSVSRGTGGKDGAWFIMPVFISYRAYTAHR